MAIDPKNKKTIDETTAYVQDTLLNVGAQIAGTIKDSIETAFDGAQAGAIKTIANDINRTFNSLVKSSSQFSANQYKIEEGLLSSKDITRDLQNLAIKRIQLEGKLDAAKKITGKNLTAAQKRGLKAAEAALNIEEGALKAAEAKMKEVEERMGITGEIFSRLGKSKFFGGLVNASGATENMRKAAVGGKKGFDLMLVGVKSMTKALKIGPLAILTGLVEIAKFFVETVFAADKQAVKVAKAFGVTKEQGRAIVQNLQDQNNYLTKALYTTEDLIAAQQGLVDFQGAYTFSQGKSIENVATLTKKLGLAGEEAAYLDTLFTNQGFTTEEVFNNTNATAVATAKNNGYLISAQSIFQELGKTSASILANFGNSGKELTAAVLQTRRFGVSLTQAANVADSLLDFEQSIGAELEAELLTGKQFTFERARALAATGDIAGATAEVLKQTQNLTDEQLRSPMIQQKLAKATGLNADELVKSIQITRALNRATKETQDLYKNAASQTEKIAIQEGILRGASFKEIKANITAQEQFNNALENAKQQFTNLVGTGFLSTFTSLLPKALKTLAFLTGQSDVYERNLRVQGLLQQENSATGQKYTGEEAQKIMTAYESAMRKHTEMTKLITNSRSGYVSQNVRDSYALSDEEKSAKAQVNKINVNDFTIKTNPKDTLVMAGGTKFGNETNSLLKRLISAVEKGATINLEGRKVGETLVMSSYKS